jgi:hypothetical protein
VPPRAPPLAAACCCGCPVVSLLLALAVLGRSGRSIGDPVGALEMPAAASARELREPGLSMARRDARLHVLRAPRRSTVVQMQWRAASVPPSRPARWPAIALKHRNRE